MGFRIQGKEKKKTSVLLGRHRMNVSKLQNCNQIRVKYKDWI